MPPLPPSFITFTGADNLTDHTKMERLSALYPIEWGILFSPERQNIDPRYPGGEAVSRLAWAVQLNRKAEPVGGLRLAAHLCGRYSRLIMDGGSIAKIIPVDLGVFTRIQINHREPIVDRINDFRRAWGPRCIAQWRGNTFPRDTSVDWLFDRSGGKGQAPTFWPPYPGRLVGYAGGIGPGNVAEVIANIAATGPYWIDMETGVRTADNCFDLDLCRQVCEIVYGAKG